MSADQVCTDAMPRVGVRVRADFFFFQAEDGIRDLTVTGVQTCALPISALDELKTHLRGAKIVLRSKTPDLVRQEFYGLLMSHFAIRGLMHEAALKAKEDQDRVSFLHAVRVVRRKLPVFSAIPPSAVESVS